MARYPLSLLITFEHGNILAIQFVWDMSTLLVQLNSPSAQAMNQLAHAVVTLCSEHTVYCHTGEVSQRRVACVFVFL